MKENKNGKKILSLGVALLIIAGIIVVSLKGFNVSLIFGKHEEIEVKVGTDVNLDTVKTICDEVFNGKTYLVRGLEVFQDSFQISVESITDEEKQNLVNKINENFGTEETIDTLKVNSVSNQRIRDSIKPYIAPMLISFAIVFIYMLIRFRKINPVKIILEFVEKVILTEAIIVSIIAITRIPVSSVMINILMVIAIAELIYCIFKSEENLKSIIED